MKRRQRQRQWEKQRKRGRHRQKKGRNKGKSNSKTHAKPKANTNSKKEISRLQIDVIPMLRHSQTQKDGNSQGTRTEAEETSMLVEVFHIKHQCSSM